MKKTIAKTMVVVLAFCLLLTACGKPNPEKTVTSFLKAGQSLNIEEMEKYVNSKEKASEKFKESTKDDYMFDYLKKSNSKMTYSIEKSEVNGDNATVTVKCKFIDSTDLMSAVMGDYLTKAMGAAFTEGDKADTDKIMKDVFTEKLKDNKDKFTEKTIKVECVKSKDSWKIKEVSDDLENVLSANMVTVSKNLEDSFNDDSEEETTQAETSTDKK